MHISTFLQKYLLLYTWITCMFYDGNAHFVSLYRPTGLVLNPHTVFSNLSLNALQVFYLQYSTVLLMSLFSSPLNKYSIITNSSLFLIPRYLFRTFLLVLYKPLSHFFLSENKHFRILFPLFSARCGTTHSSHFSNCCSVGE